MAMLKKPYFRRGGGILAVAKGNEALAQHIGPEFWLYKMPSPTAKSRGTAMFSAPSGQRFVVKPRRTVALMHDPTTGRHETAKVKRGLLGEMRTAERFREVTGVDAELPVGVFVKPFSGKPPKAATYTIFRHAGGRPLAYAAELRPKQHRRLLDSLADALAKIHSSFVVGFDPKAEHVMFDPKSMRVRLIDVENATFWKRKDAARILPRAMIELTQMIADASYRKIIKVGEIEGFLKRYASGAMPLFEAFAEARGLPKPDKKMVEGVVIAMFASNYKKGYEATKRISSRQEE